MHVFINIQSWKLKQFSRSITTTVGQEAAEAIHLKRGETKVLKGFMVNDNFIKLDLVGNWARTGFINGK
jgi:hypothetical protein